MSHMKRIFSLNIEYADSAFDKFRGLMFRTKFNGALWFRFAECSHLMTSIHSLFVFFPFDIIWLNGRTVVDMRENVRPFTLNVTPKSAADAFIELPAGTIKKHKIKLRQKLALK